MTMTILAALLLSVVQPPTITLTVHDASGHTHVLTATRGALVWDAGNVTVDVFDADGVFGNGFEGR